MIYNIVGGKRLALIVAMRCNICTKVDKRGKPSLAKLDL